VGADAWRAAPVGGVPVDRGGPVGYGEGVIEQLQLDGGEEPLAWLHGRYRSVGDLSGQG
jgi:hypothetical protein